MSSRVDYDSLPSLLEGSEARVRRLQGRSLLYILVLALRPGSSLQLESVAFEIASIIAYTTFMEMADGNATAVAKRIYENLALHNLVDPNREPASWRELYKMIYVDRWDDREKQVRAAIRTAIMCHLIRPRTAIEDLIIGEVAPLL
jgi:hypothetical protein